MLVFRDPLKKYYWGVILKQVSIGNIVLLLRSLWRWVDNDLHSFGTKVLYWRM